MALVLAFGGVTCGGKSTTSAAIQKLLPSCCVVGQDDYYLPDDHPRWKYDGTDNWDEIEAFDMVRMVEDVKKKCVTYKLVIVEGVLLFEEEEMNKLFDKRYFFTLPYDICKERRAARVYMQAGEPAVEPPDYFDRIYWTYYQTQLQAISTRTDIVTIDSAETIATLTHRLHTDIIRLMTTEKKL